MKIIVTRPMLCKGERVEAGATLDLTPLEAGEAIASGRATLADRADLERVNAAVAEDRDKMVARLTHAEKHALRLLRRA